jgi:hypothetical protein
MAEVSPRLVARVQADFSAPDAERVLEALSTIPESLPLGEKQDAERLQAAVILSARGDHLRFEAALREAHRDWRDLLMGTDLAHGYWPERLDAELAPGVPEK